MAFVQKHDRVRRQIVQQGRRGRTFRATGQVARVVFNAFAKADLLQHFQIVPGALLDALRFHELVLALEKTDARRQLALDGFNRRQHGAARGDIVAGGVNGVARHFLHDVAGERVEQRQAFDFIVEQAKAQGVLAVFRREHVNHLAAHAELAPRKIQLVALVLHFGQALDDGALTEGFALAHMQNHAVVIHRVANAVNRRHRGHNHAILPLQNGLGGRQAHLLDLLVDTGILLDVHIPRRDVGFRLVVVVVGHEILHGIFREEFAHLGIQLRRQGFVGSHHHGRATGAGDDIGHGVSLAGASHAQQRLKRQPIAQALHQLRDGRRLIARRGKRLVQTVRAIGKGDDVHGGLRWGAHCSGIIWQLASSSAGAPCPLRHLSRVARFILRVNRQPPVHAGCC